MQTLFIDGPLVPSFSDLIPLVQSRVAHSRMCDKGPPAGKDQMMEERIVSDAEEEDFAAMLEASLQARQLEKGEPVEGRIVAIGPEVALVDVGGKGEAVIDIDELKNPEGEIEVAVGEPIQAMVVSTTGGVTLSRRLAGASASDRLFEDAFHSGLPADGKV